MRRRDLLFGLIGASVLAVPVKAGGPRSYVVGSTLISGILNDLLSGNVEIHELIAGVACPGHTDVKASDIIFALHADAILVHGFQRRLSSLEQMFSVEPKLRKRTQVIDVCSSWLIPSVQIKASEEIGQLLLKDTEDASSRERIEQRLRERVARIRALESEYEPIRRKLQGRAVIASKMQEDFLRWVGLRVVGTFGSADSLEPRRMTELVRIGRQESAIGVVDNLQSGPDAGRPIAQELRIARTVLSNFPGSSEAVLDYFSLIRDNMRQLARFSKD